MVNNTHRDISIDIIKFLAVFLIINSHMDSLYTRWSILATGGAIGDVLFLFCSGYTLLLSNKKENFIDWYKRRIIRIYPSVIVCSIVAILFSGTYDIDFLALVGGEFIVAIMIYYAIIYFIKTYAVNKIPMIIVLCGLVSLFVYIFLFPYKYETGVKGLYGTSTLFRWLPYFAFMLFGAWIGQNRSKLTFSIRTDVLMLLISGIVFYGVQLAAKLYPPVAPSQIVTLIPLMGVVYYGYKSCNAAFWTKAYQSRIGGPIILTISGLCLESYLIQGCLFTTKMNSIFPFNLIIMVVIVLIVAYICKCLSNLLIQSFRNDRYDWKSIFKLY